MRIILVACALFSSLVAEAACRPGGMTTVSRPVDFIRKEATGNVLRVTMAAGSEVHIISMDQTKIELLASTQFQGQMVSLLGEVEASGSAALACSNP